MAVQTMGQLYCGQVFSRKWNAAYKSATEFVFSTVQDMTVDQFPQDLFDDLVATAFWRCADALGGVPKNVEGICDVPERPVKSWNELSVELAKFRLINLDDHLGNFV